MSIKISLSDTDKEIYLLKVRLLYEKTSSLYDFLAYKRELRVNTNLIHNTYRINSKGYVEHASDI